MALSTPSISRTLYTTPKRLGRTPAQPGQTPECFGKVTLETPVAMKRRSSRDKFDQEKNLTVAVRIRPMNQRELELVGGNDVTSVEEKELTIRTNFSNNQTNLDHIFQYDHIFLSSNEQAENFSSQEDIFEVMGLPLLDSAFRGYNACLFAYGQTGSGKSYSMMGSSTEITDINEHSGMIPRFCKELFNRVDELPKGSIATVEICYFEIYNEKIHDLLLDYKNSQRTPLKVREHPVWGPYVVNLSVQLVKTFAELNTWLSLGNKNRATAATAMNEKSSRSHSIFSIEICLSEGSGDEDSSRRSKLSLVDLAGSERLFNTNNEERIRQGVSINKSLLTLGKVISALAENKKGTQFVPYRDSVLTWLLRESLGGNSLTTMLATITPASSNLEETLSTLRYACQARSIVNRARINESPHDKLIRELRAEVERLRALRQDYERNSLGGSSINISHDEKNQEFDELRVKLASSEGKLLEAQQCWERRFMENNEKNLKELSEYEKHIEQLQAQIRVITKSSDSEMSISPYRTNFLEQLESALAVSDCTNTIKKYTKKEVSIIMNQAYESINKFKPLVEDSEENVKNIFKDVNEKLRLLEVSLKNSVSKKTVTFK